MATFVNDTFTESGGDVFLSGHTGETGATWTLHPNYSATLSVDATDDRVYGPSATGAGMYYASGTPATANYYVEGVIDYVGSGFNYPGVCGRVSTSANSCYFFRISQSAGEVQLGKLVGGSFSVQDTYSLTTTTNMTLKLEMISDGIKGYVDGVERCAITDSDITDAGRVGVRYSSGGGSLGKLIGNQITSLTAVDLAPGGQVVTTYVHDIR